MLEIETHSYGIVTALRVSGRIDSISAEKLQNAIDETLHLPDIRLLLDLEHVNYMSAAGLRVLRNLREQHGAVHIAQPSDRVREVMQITGLDATYTLYDTLTNALHSAAPVTNAHTHLEWGWLRKGLPPINGRDFAPWMKTAIHDRLKSIPEPAEAQRLFRESAEAGVQELIACGTTVVGDISSSGQSIPALLNAHMRGIVYIELSGRDAFAVETRMGELRATIEKWQPKMRGGLQLGISLHAPYALHPDLWKQGLAYAQEAHLPLCIHVAQSPAETHYMNDGTGDLHEVLFKNATPLEPSGKSPVQFLEAIGALEQKPLLVHGIHVSDDDLALIKQYGCTVVHCPRSNFRLRAGRMPLEQYIQQEIPVLLGTESLVSSPSLNVFDEIEFAAAWHDGHVTPEQLLSFVHLPLPLA